MEQRLAPQGFLRVQRGTLVRMDRVLELEPLFHGEYVVRLKDGTRLVSGRTYRKRIQEAFALRE
jgi:two-component system LytT family response regulator